MTIALIVLGCLAFAMLVGFVILFAKLAAWLFTMLIGTLVIVLYPLRWVAQLLVLPLRGLGWILSRGAGPLGGLRRTQTVERNVDGDTVIINKKRVRIAYIDAPEMDQTLQGSQQNAGLMAKQAIDQFLKKNAQVEVLPIDVDIYGRQVAQLRLNGYDVGMTMIKLGMAIASRDAPIEYKEAERDARDHRRGLFAQGGFIDPQLHRIFST